ncbi:MAG: biopolymer transporter ExbD [Planctomycetota bacterium]|nr:biopolymer transporter ExbD [Planctomycetota bacterium]MDA1105293.1 biopolymer transporter ExbD [Planctomycetota bacterium]
MRFASHALRRRSRSTVLGLTSMIDATFLLLAYFIFTSGMQRPESDLRAQTATESDRASGAAMLEPQVVDVLPGAAGGAVFRLGVVNHSDRQSLETALRGLPRGPGLVVRVHDGVIVADAAAAMQAGRNAGFEEVSYVPALP